MRTPLSPRPVSDTVPFTVRDCRATVAAYTSFLPAGTHIPEADPSETVAAYPAVIDTERDTLYGNGVEQQESILAVPEMPHKVAPQASVRPGTAELPSYEYGAVLAAVAAADRYEETARRARLSRWQEQR